MAEVPNFSPGALPMSGALTMSRLVLTIATSLFLIAFASIIGGSVGVITLYFLTGV